MKTLVVSHFKPFPPNHGAARRTWEVASDFSKLGEVVLIHNILNGCNKRSETVESGVRLVGVPFLFKFMRKKHFLFQNNFSIFIEMFKNRDADTVIVEFPYLLPAALFAKALGKKLVYNAHGVEYEWQKEMYNRGRLTLLLTQAIEKGMLSISDWVLCCSERDKNELIRIYGVNPEKLKAVKPQVDMSLVEKAKPFDFGRKTVLFIGSQDHPANKEAIEKIFYEIIPKVVSKNNNAQFCFIGKNPPGWLKGENVLVIPEVYDGNVFPYIKGADVCIAPIFRGSGVRIKILEYLACKKPVVTTAKGIEGIEAKENVLMADSVNEFSECIIKMLS